MIALTLSRQAQDLEARLTDKARMLGEAAGEARLARQALEGAQWRDARLLWPETRWN